LPHAGVDVSGCTVRCFSSKVDVFATGLVLHFIATIGGHPFAPQPGRMAEFAISCVHFGQQPAPALDEFSDAPVLQSLISSMIQMAPADRCAAGDVRVRARASARA